MKLKKKSGLMGAVIALSAASLVSVGFASWVITQSDTAVIQGNIHVDTVEDDRHLIRNAEGAKTFQFNYGNNVAGKPASSIFFGWDNTGVDADDVWLENSDIDTTEKTKAENLTASVDLYLYQASGTYASSDFDVTVALAEETTTDQTAAWNAAIAGNANGGYIEGLGEAEIVISDVAAASITGMGDKLFKKATLTITFDWGDAFGGNNPYIYYNDGVKTADSHGDEAYTALKAIEALEGINFTVTVAWKNA